MREGTLKDGVQMSRTGGWKRGQGGGKEGKEPVCHCEGAGQQRGVLRDTPSSGPQAERGRDEGGRMCSRGATCGPCDVGCCWHGHRGAGCASAPGKISQTLGAERGQLVPDPHEADGHFRGGHLLLPLSTTLGAPIRCRG